MDDSISSITPPKRAPWRVALLGALSARREDVALSHFRSHQTGALLAFLAFHRGKAWGRAALIEMLWPDCDEKAGRNRLSVALSSLRAALQDDLFQTDRDFVTLRANAVQTDVGDFENALRLAAREPDEAVAHLSGALKIYGGPLLPGFDEEWIAPQARRLEDEFFRAARRLIGLHRESGERGLALKVAQRAVIVDPTREDVQRDFIRLLAQTGQIEAARKQGEEVRRVVRERLGCEPDATTRALLAELETRAQTAVRAASGKTPGKVLNRPAPRTRFFGRERDLAALHVWLDDPCERLLLVSGGGGGGKTRLVSEFARTLELQSEFVSRFPGGAAFVPLAEVFEAALLPDALRGALRLPPAPGVDATDQLVEALSPGASLLVLDNFEQLLPDGAVLLETLLDRLPSLKLLVTSRRRLYLEGEREHFVAPLGSSSTSSPGEAALLFEDRARLARPDFALGDHNREAVETLCARLDGSPLAIELAAARAGVMTPAHILAHLGEKLDLLAAPHLGVPPRHRTLRAAIEWSFRLLPRELQEFWARLSVFRGGCCFESAREVCGEKGALDALALLRDHSLLRTEERGGEMRFSLGETLREFADEQLSAAARAQVHHHHLTFFARLATDSEPALLEAEQAQWLCRLDAESANLNFALAFALQNEPETALRMSVKMATYWECRGLFAQGARWMQSALEAQPDSACDEEEAAEIMESGLAATPDFWRGRACVEAGRLASCAGNYAQARELLKQGITIFKNRNDEIAFGWAFNILGVILVHQGEEGEARRLHDEALAIARKHGYREFEVECLSGLAELAISSGDVGLLQEVAAPKLELQRALHNERGVAFALLDCALLADFEGNFARGHALCEQSLEIFRVLSEPRGTGRALIALAALQRRGGEIERAQSTCRQALDVLVPTNNALEMVALLEQFAYGFVAQEDVQNAASLLGAAQNARDHLSIGRPRSGEREFAQSVHRAKNMVGQSVFEKLWAQGQTLSLQSALARV